MFVNYSMDVWLVNTVRWKRIGMCSCVQSKGADPSATHDLEAAAMQGLRQLRARVAQPWMEAPGSCRLVEATLGQVGGWVRCEWGLGIVLKFVPM